MCDPREIDSRCSKVVCDSILGKSRMENVTKATDVRNMVNKDLSEEACRTAFRDTIEAMVMVVSVRNMLPKTKQEGVVERLCAALSYFGRINLRWDDWYLPQEPRSWGSCLWTLVQAINSTSSRDRSAN